MFSPSKSSKEVLQGVFSNLNRDNEVNRIAENLSRMHLGNSSQGTEGHDEEGHNVGEE